MSIDPSTSTESNNGCPQTVGEYLQILSSSADHLSNLRLILSNLCTQFKAKQGYIVAIDPLTSMLSVEATYGEGWDEKLINRIINLEDKICGVVATDLKIVYGTTREIYDSTENLFPQTESVVAIPIIVEQKLAGIMVILFDRVNSLNQEELQFLYDISPVAGICLRNSLYLQEVEVSRAEWFQTFQSLPDGIAIARDDQVIRRCNKSFIDMLGIPREKLIGLSLNELLEITLIKDGSQTKRFEINEPTRTGNFVEFKDIIKDETYILNLTPTINNGHFAWLFVLKNMTEQRAIEAQLIQSDKLAALGEMIAGVAHEINNPLTTIMGQSELLGMAKDIVKSQKSAKLILHEAHRAARIVKNLLIFSRAHEPEKVPVNINELLDQTLELWNYQIKVNNISIEKAYSPNIPQVFVDYYQIQQVVFNLIQNSQQAIATDKKTGLVRISTEILNDRFVRIIFSDNGPGIPAEHIRKVFNPFFTTKSIGKGTGLGLSITYGIISAHGGTISCQSEPDKGTSFIIDLPILPEGQNPLVVAEDTELPRIDPKIIFVIDDEEGILRFIKDSLELKGHQITTFHDGQIARDYMNENYFDIVFCDIKMPAPNGIEIFKQLSEEEREKIIFITGDLVSSETKAFVESTGRPCVLKPFTTTHLIKALLELENNQASSKVTDQNTEKNLKG